MTWLHAEKLTLINFMVYFAAFDTQDDYQYIQLTTA